MLEGVLTMLEDVLAALGGVLAMLECWKDCLPC